METTLKSCCLETWYETNLAIRMVTWEIMRQTKEGDARKSQDELFPISYTCIWCGNKWSNKTNI